MCFAIIAGRDTTVSGNVMLGANDDWPGYPGHVRYKPRARHAPGAMHTLASGAAIPQPAETAAYYTATCAYATGTLPESWAFGINEHQVSVAMTGVYAFRFLRTGGAMEADDLSVLVLERGRTAREAVRLIGDLIERHGLGLSCVDEAYGAVVMAIADPDEGWWLEATPGGLWAAQRVPDDMVSWRPNCFGLQELDFNDTANIMCSPDLIARALEQGWYGGSGPFNFAKVMGADGPTEVVYGNEDGPINSYRRWHAQRLVSGREQGLDEKQYFGRPDRKLSARDFMNILRDSSEGSRYDLAKAPEAGPYHNPFWKPYSTSIGQSGTVISFVFEARRELPPEIGGLMWMAFSNTHLTSFIPCYIGGEGTLEDLVKGEYGQFDPNVPWWIFQELGQVCYRNYDEAARRKVIPAMRKLEDEFLASQRFMEDCFERALKQDPDSGRRMMNDYNKACAAKAISLAGGLTSFVKGHYFSNIVVEE
ncbi:C69 family dipeptidase [Deltaproteobacteria bacterium OttesenSCG-928-M10]|nr:C69 family dipeptidase [Deltaproteobacteria bacterium OttesenSCG-928-M10]